MKKSLLFVAALLSFIGNAQILPSFTLTNVTGSNSITCAQTSINYIANGAPNLTYIWASSSTTLSGSNVNINLPGTYTVTASDSLNTSIQMIVVGINTLTPVSLLTPTIGAITCALNSAITFTGTSTNTNCTQYFSSPLGGTAIFNTSTALYTPFAPGTYTHMVEDNLNGCKTIKIFAITSNTNHPTFGLTSPQSFTLGCGTKSVAVISINNAQTTPTPGGAVTYTLIGPPTSTNYIPGTLSTYSLAIAGTWTAIVKDVANNCESKVPFTVLQNTASPALSVTVPIQVLDCITTSVILNGSSSTPNVSYLWDYSSALGGSFNDSIVVNTNIIAPSSTLINTYTLTILDNSSACKTMTVIPMYQNTFKPNAGISSGGNFTITCLTPTIALTNISSSGIPPSTGFPINMPVIGLLWTGPSPLLPAANSSTYLASIAGTYTMMAKDLNNGCTSPATITIVGDCNKVGLEKNSALNSDFSVFPNPNNGLFTVISNHLFEYSKIEIYNTLGVMVKREPIYSERTLIDIQETVKGIYIVQVYENNKIIYVSKVIHQ